MNAHSSALRTLPHVGRGSPIANSSISNNPRHAATPARHKKPAECCSHYHDNSMPHSWRFRERVRHRQPCRSSNALVSLGVDCRPPSARIAIHEASNAIPPTRPTIFARETINRTRASREGKGFRYLLCNARASASKFRLVSLAGIPSRAPEGTVSWGRPPGDQAGREACPTKFPDSRMTSSLVDYAGFAWFSQETRRCRAGFQRTSDNTSIVGRYSTFLALGLGTIEPPRQ